MTKTTRTAKQKQAIAAAIIQARDSRRPLGISQAASRARRAMGQRATPQEVALLANQLITMAAAR